MTDKQFVEISRPAFALDREEGDHKDQALLHANYQGETRIERDIDARKMSAALLKAVKDEFVVRNGYDEWQKPLCTGCVITLLINTIGMVVDGTELKNCEAVALFESISDSFKEDHDNALEAGVGLVVTGKHSMEQAGLEPYEHPAGEKARRKAFDGVESYGDPSEGDGMGIADLIAAIFGSKYSGKVTEFETKGDVTIGMTRHDTNDFPLNNELNEKLIAAKGWTAEIEAWVIENGGVVREAPEYGGLGDLKIKWPEGSNAKAA